MSTPAKRSRVVVDATQSTLKKKPKHGGDRKSIKYYSEQNRMNNQPPISSYFPAQGNSLAYKNLSSYRAAEKRKDEAVAGLAEADTLYNKWTSMYAEFNLKSLHDPDNPEFITRGSNALYEVRDARKVKEECERAVVRCQRELEAAAEPARVEYSAIQAAAAEAHKKAKENLKKQSNAADASKKRRKDALDDEREKKRQKAEAEVARRNAVAEMSMERSTIETPGGRIVPTDLHYEEDGGVSISGYHANDKKKKYHSGPLIAKGKDIAPLVDIALKNKTKALKGANTRLVNLTTRLNTATEAMDSNQGDAEEEQTDFLQSAVKEAQEAIIKQKQAVVKAKENVVKATAGCMRKKESFVLPEGVPAWFSIDTAVNATDGNSHTRVLKQIKKITLTEVVCWENDIGDETTSSSSSSVLPTVLRTDVKEISPFVTIMFPIGSVFREHNYLLQKKPIMPDLCERKRKQEMATKNKERNDGAATHHRSTGDIEHVHHVTPKYSPNFNRKLNKINKANNKDFWYAHKQLKTFLRHDKVSHPRLMEAELKVVASPGWNSDDGPDPGQIQDLICGGFITPIVKTLLSHMVKTAGHELKRQQQDLAKVARTNAYETFTNRTAGTNMKNQTVDPRSIAARIQLLATQLKSCTGTKALDTFRTFLDRYCKDIDFTGASHMGQHVEDVQKMMMDEIKKDFETFSESFGESVIIVDGTNLNGAEKTCVLTRTCDNFLYVQERLISIFATANHLTGDAQARLLIAAMQTVGLELKKLIGLCADRVNANGVTADVLVQSINASLFLVGCFSHTLDKFGKKCNTPALDKFMPLVRSLLGLSSAAKALFKMQDKNHRNLVGYAAIRWWNNFVQMLQISEMQNGISSIIDIAKTMQSNELCKRSAAGILELLEPSNGDKRPLACLKMELAASLDHGMEPAKMGFNCETNADGGILIAGEACLKLKHFCEGVNIDKSRMTETAQRCEEIVGSQAAALVALVAAATTAIVSKTAELDASKLAVASLSKPGAGEKEQFIRGDNIVSPSRRSGSSNRRSSYVVMKVESVPDGTFTCELKNFQTKETTYNVDTFNLRKEITTGRSVAKRNLDADTALKEQQEALTARLDLLRLALVRKKALDKELVELNKQLLEAKAARTNFGPVSKEDWMEFGNSSVAGGIQYIKERFCDTDSNYVGYGALQVNKGKQAVKAAIATRFLIPDVGCDMTEAQMCDHIDACGKYFDFVTPEMVTAAKKDVPSFNCHMKIFNVLPAINLKNSRIMQKMNKVKKHKARKEINVLRRSFIASERLRVHGNVAGGNMGGGNGGNGGAMNNNGNEEPDEEDQEDREDQEEQEEQEEEEEEEEEDQEDGYAHTPEDRDLPIGRVRAPLVSDVKRINERAFAIVEWYRLPAGVSLTENRARFERWPGIGKLLQMIILCSPSSASAERVFSLLKLVLSAKDYAKLASTGFVSAALRYNDTVTA